MFTFWLKKKKAKYTRKTAHLKNSILETVFYFFVHEKQHSNNATAIVVTQYFGVRGDFFCVSCFTRKRTGGQQKKGPCAILYERFAVE